MRYAMMFTVRLGPARPVARLLVPVPVVVGAGFDVRVFCLYRGDAPKADDRYWLECPPEDANAFIKRRAAVENKLRYTYKWRVFG